MIRKQPRRGHRFCGLCHCKAHAWAKLTRAFVVMVSPADAHLIQSRKWCTITSGGGRRRVLYAKAGASGKGRQPLLHRLICKPGSRRQVDHKNGHGLDCTRDNLRPATKRQNAGNRRRERGAAPYRGVSVSKSGKRFHAYCAGKHLGSFNSPVAAAREYDRAARKRYGAFAILNRPHNHDLPPTKENGRQTPERRRPSSTGRNKDARQKYARR